MNVSIKPVGAMKQLSSEKSKIEALKVVQIKDIDGSPETIHEESLCPSPNSHMKNALQLRND